MGVGWECEISLGHKEKDDVLDGFVAQTMIICLKEAANPQRDSFDKSQIHFIYCGKYLKRINHRNSIRSKVWKLAGTLSRKKKYIAKCFSGNVIKKLMGGCFGGQLNLRYINQSVGFTPLGAKPFEPPVPDGPRPGDWRGSSLKVFSLHVILVRILKIHRNPGRGVPYPKYPFDGDNSLHILFCKDG